MYQILNHKTQTIKMSVTELPDILEEYLSQPNLLILFFCNPLANKREFTLFKI